MKMNDKTETREAAQEPQRRADEEQLAGWATSEWFETWLRLHYAARGQN